MRIISLVVHVLIVGKVGWDFGDVCSFIVAHGGARLFVWVVLMTWGFATFASFHVVLLLGFDQFFVFSHILYFGCFYRDV